MDAKSFLNEYADLKSQCDKLKAQNEIYNKQFTAVWTKLASKSDKKMTQIEEMLQFIDTLSPKTTTIGRIKTTPAKSVKLKTTDTTTATTNHK